VDPVATAHRLVREARKTGRLTRARFQRSTVGGAPDEVPSRLEAHLREAGIAFDRWEIPLEGFSQYLDTAHYPDSYLGGHGGGDPFFGEKALEHYASMVLGEVRAGTVLIDVASNGGPFIDIATRLAGCTCYEQDLQFPPGRVGRRIGGDAADMDIPDGFADVLTLHCSYDHFEGIADTGFAVEAGRILRPGGVAVILPLYLSPVFGAKVDPELRLGDLRLDPHAMTWLMPKLAVRFSRVYDAEHLRRRVLDPAQAAGLETTVLRVTNASEAYPGAYLHWALVLRKPGPS
jgi:SAM-dependent methyltransferase